MISLVPEQFEQQGHRPTLQDIVQFLDLDHTLDNVFALVKFLLWLGIRLGKLDPDGAEDHIGSGQAKSSYPISRSTASPLGICFEISHTQGLTPVSFDVRSVYVSLPA